MRAQARVDVAAAIIGGKRTPCICPRQFEKNAPMSRPLTYSTSGNRPAVRVECERCLRQWVRIDIKD